MKQIIKKFNNLAQKTIFKVENKTNDKFKISRTNKALITFIGLLFLYIFYLLIPLIYDKDWVKNKIQTHLYSEFKINLNFTEDISYRILPAPHFLIKNSKILVNETEKKKSISEIKFLKVFINQGNFFDKEKIKIKKIIIDEANLSLLRSDLKLIKQYKDTQFSNNKIKINSSKIFLKDNLNEIISIIKIDEATLFFDDKKMSNLLNLDGEIFNIPFTLDFINKNDLIKSEEINFKAKSLNLNISNKSIIEKDNFLSGKNIISLLNTTINTKYDIEEKLITFVSENSRMNNSKINYSGELSINPFDLELEVDLNDYSLSLLFDSKPILSEFLKSKLLFNENISINTSIDINSSTKNEIFQDAKINFRIVNGKIDFNNTLFINNDIGSLELSNSNLFFKNNNLILNTDIFIDIKNSNELFSSLNTSKLLRKDLKKIFINLNYHFFSNQIEFKNVKVDNHEASDQLLTIIDGFKDNNSNNLNKSRRLINELLKAYEG